MESASTPSLDRPTDGDELAEWQDSSSTQEHDSGAEWRAHSSVGADSDLCSSAAKDDDVLVSCEVE